MDYLNYNYWGYPYFHYEDYSPKMHYFDPFYGYKDQYYKYLGYYEDEDFYQSYRAVEQDSPG